MERPARPCPGHTRRACQRHPLKSEPRLDQGPPLAMATPSSTRRCTLDPLVDRLSVDRPGAEGVGLSGSPSRITPSPIGGMSPVTTATCPWRTYRGSSGSCSGRTRASAMASRVTSAPTTRRAPGPPPHRRRTRAGPGASGDIPPCRHDEKADSAGSTGAAAVGRPRGRAAPFRTEDMMRTASSKPDDEDDDVKNGLSARDGPEEGQREGHAWRDAARFAPAAPSCCRRKPCPAPSKTWGV